MYRLFTELGFCYCQYVCMFHYLSLLTHVPASVAPLDAPSDWRPGGHGFNPPPRSKKKNVHNTG